MKPPPGSQAAVIIVIAVVLSAMVLLTLYLLHRLPVTSDHFSRMTLIWTGDHGVLDEVSWS